MCTVGNFIKTLCFVIVMGRIGNLLNKLRKPYIFLIVHGEIQNKVTLQKNVTHRLTNNTGDSGENSFCKRNKTPLPRRTKVLQ